MYFGSLLKSTLKENKIPVTHFASAMKLNRVAVYSVFNGEKHLSEDTFNRVLETFPFTPEQETELLRAFRLSTFSRKKLEGMEFLVDEIARIGKAPDCGEIEKEPLDFSNESAILSSEAQYHSAIEALLKIESEHGKSTVYTNYSFFDEPADKITFDFISQDDCPLSIRHTIVKGNKDNLKERLRNGFASIKFAVRGHVTDIAEENEQTYTFPVHFAGEHATVMFDPRTGHGFFTTNGPVVRAYYISAASRDSERPQLNRFIDDPFELKSITEPLMMSPHIIFESNVPICYFTERDVLDETLKKGLPNREIILSAFWNHLLICRSIKAPTIFLKSAIKVFAQKGKSYEAPNTFLNFISVKNRKKILLETKESILKDDSSIFIVDDGMINICENFEVYNFDRCTMVAYVTDKPGCDFIGSGLFTVNDSSFLPLLNDFYDYLIVNDYLLSKAEAAKALDEGIALCDEMIEKGIE
ncbi:MAG: hypothetical protein Q4D20_05255 [Clostridia bacterium]|nr:hypothetical protein [Clostridia bacterium]